MVRTTTHLLLRHERGALTVHGVVGEVVREGFGSLPHGVSCDAIWDLQTENTEFRARWTISIGFEINSIKSTFRLVMVVLVPSILMMHFAVRSFSLKQF